MARTLRLVTRRFPRSILHITGAQLDKGRGKAEAGKVAQQKVDFFAALVRRQEGIVVDEVAEEKARLEKLRNADRGLWHGLASKGILKLLLVMANAKGDKEVTVHTDCARILQHY